MGSEGLLRQPYRRSELLQQDIGRQFESAVWEEEDGQTQGVLIADKTELVFHAKNTSVADVSVGETYGQCDMFDTQSRPAHPRSRNEKRYKTVTIGMMRRSIFLNTLALLTPDMSKAWLEGGEESSLRTSASSAFSRCLGSFSAMVVLKCQASQANQYGRMGEGGRKRGEYQEASESSGI